MTEEQNRALTEVGAGTPMGELLRRYWMPIAAATEFDRQAIKPLRLLGEDLVLYKDLSGQWGLLDRHCPHRRADLANGYVEACGLRCSYHGWLMQHGGECLEQPFEDTSLAINTGKSRVRTQSYPVRELAGLLWTYMGPLPAPELPVWEPFTWANGFREIVISEVPCNWFQCQENSCDPVHFEWMHDNMSIRQTGATGPYASRHLKLDFDEFEHGFTYKRIREGMDDRNEVWTIGRVALWPNAFYLGDHFEWRIPVDDTRTLSVSWFFARVPLGREPYVQGAVPHWQGPLKDERGEWINTHVLNQDFLAWMGQGVIADRTKERLASSDRGITMMRRRYVDEMDKVARGDDPKGVIRDAEAARCVRLPIAYKSTYTEGVPIERWASHPLLRLRLDGFHWQAGQPAAVWNAYAQAMGFGPEAMRNAA